jgi:putative ABC transport system permease protein
LKETSQRQNQLPLRKAAQIAWKNIRIRWWRSMLVTSGIILALAFLMYILCSDMLSRNIPLRGSPEMVEELMKQGVVLDAADSDASVQTWWMVGLALLISFVGILNAMVMSVTERFREIGTMKCLGALDSFIVKLYLLESIFQGCVGTLIGLSLGIGLALLEGLSIYGAETWRLMPGVTFVRLVAICLLTGVILTILSALYPAWRAAKMQPVDAMRSEI